MSLGTTTVYGILPAEGIKKEIISNGSITPVVGIKFPLFNPNEPESGIFKPALGMELVKSMVRQFIQTERGERVMLPNYGLSLNRFLFSPITPELILNIQNEIFTGFGQYLPNIEILNLQVLRGDSIQGLGLPGIKVTLVISPRNSNEQAEISLNL